MSEQPLLYRSAQIDTNDVDLKNRTVKMSFASVSPVSRSFGREILSHDSGAMVTDRLDRKAVPFLLNHRTDDQIGKVIDYYQSSQKSFATVKFSRSPKAEEILQDIADGVRGEVSFGYKVSRLVRSRRADPNNKEDMDDYTATRWQPVEVSLVSVPADIEVGIGKRSEDCSTSYRDAIFTDEEGKEIEVIKRDDTSIRSDKNVETGKPVGEQTSTQESARGDKPEDAAPVVVPDVKPEVSEAKELAELRSRVTELETRVAAMKETMRSDIAEAVSSHSVELARSIARTLVLSRVK